MNEIMKFENISVDIQIINGVPMFELYSVGMALGHVRYAKGKAYPRKDRINQNADNAEIQPVVHNGQLYITESQLYDLMLEMRTDKCRTFRKWITNEVLPTIRKTGSYKVPVDKEEVSDIEEKSPRLKMAKKLLDVSEMDELPKKYRNLIIAIAVEIMTGKKILHLGGDLRSSEESEKPKTYLAGDIAKMFGTSAYEIGCIANAFGMKNSEYGEWYYTTTADSEKIRAFKYNEKAVEKFGLIFESIDK